MLKIKFSASFAPRDPRILQVERPAGRNDWRQFGRHPAARQCLLEHRPVVQPQEGGHCQRRRRLRPHIRHSPARRFRRARRQQGALPSARRRYHDLARGRPRPQIHPASAHPQGLVTRPAPCRSCT